MCNKSAAEGKASSVCVADDGAEGRQTVNIKTRKGGGEAAAVKSKCNYKTRIIADTREFAIYIRRRRRGG